MAYCASLVNLPKSEFIIVPRPNRDHLFARNGRPELELSSELHYSGVSRRGLFSKAIRLGLYTCILYMMICLLMGDDPPQDSEIENLLYRHGFLTSLFKRRLGILAAQGEGL